MILPRSLLSPLLSQKENRGKTGAAQKVHSSGDQVVSAGCENNMLKAGVLHHNRAEKRNPMEGTERPYSLYIALRNHLVSSHLSFSSPKPPALTLLLGRGADITNSSAVVAAITGQKICQDYRKKQDRKNHFLWYNFKITMSDKDI